MMVMAVPAVKTYFFLGYEIFRQRADGVKVRLVCGGKQVAERARHVTRELRLAYRCQPAERAKRLHEPLHCAQGKLSR